MLPVDTNVAKHETSCTACAEKVVKFVQSFQAYFLLFVESLNKCNKLRVALRNEVLSDPCCMWNDESFLKWGLSSY